MTLTQLFIDRTIMANHAENQIDHDRLCAERRGILDSIGCLKGQIAEGNAIMAADRFYIDNFPNSGGERPMCGGLFLDWKPNDGARKP